MLVICFLGLSFRPLLSCTAFYVTGNENILVGKNLDSTDPNTKMWFIPPENGKYGWMYFSLGNGFPQGGMNDKGLFWEGTSASYRDMPLSVAGKKRYTGHHLMQKILEECSTVREAMAVFEDYYFSDLFDAQYLVGDKEGDSFVIEGDVRASMVSCHREHIPLMISTLFALFRPRSPLAVDNLAR